MRKIKMEVLKSLARHRGPVLAPLSCSVSQLRYLRFSDFHSRS